MAGILVYSDSADLAAELAGFASASGQESYALALAKDQVDALAGSGVGTVLVAETEPAMLETCAKSIAKLIEDRGIGLVLVGATPRGRDLGARIAGYLDCGFGSDTSQVVFDGQTTSFERSIYGGKVVSKEHIDGRAVITVGRGLAEPASGSAAVEAVAIEADGRATLIARDAIVAEGVDLVAADCVVGIGMGVATEDDVHAAEELANAMGGATACSRGVAEERKWLPVDRYIGISGKVISPKLYLSLGISGQVQHLFGVRDAKIIAAVDKNENAPIFKNADYCIVGDEREIVPLLIEAVKSR